MGPPSVNADATACDALEIDFVERGLVPGQNYAYVGSSSKGFVFVENVIGLPDQCPGPDREPVPIHIRYTNYELVDIFTTSFADVTGVFAGPIEPD
jgi:hypothetical protein